MVNRVHLLALKHGFYADVVMILEVILLIFS